MQLEEIKTRILETANARHEDVVGFRRHLHQNPELSFEEHETSRYIQDVLTKLGVTFQAGWAGTGVVATIRGEQGNGRTIALRGDMDALPIQEENSVDYASNVPGVMHACGHDVHTSSLLGVAAILNSMRDRLRGNVRLIFQPGEERMPGGASLLIDEGVLENPVPDAILGQHVHPQLKVGQVGFCPGMSMASADEIRLLIHGKGGHAAMPHNTVDTVMATVEILSALQQIVSRKNNPLTPSVLSFGKLTSVGGTYNVIPDTVEVLGTFRTFDESWRYEAHAHLKSIATQVAAGLGASCEVEVTVGYPSLRNDPDLTRRCFDLAVELLGPDRVVEIPPRMTAEDFAYYSQHLPACFYRLGVTPQDADEVHHVHTPRFDIDEQALVTGPALMSWLAFRMLEE